MSVATKTTTVRGEDGMPERLIAGVSFVHDQRHWLLKTYRELFAPDTQAHRCRGRSTRAVSPAPVRPAARRERPTWRPFVRVSDAAPTFTVRLSDQARLSMTDQAYTQQGRLETGGALFGYPARQADDTLAVKRAGAPGPKARSSRSRMHVDLDHIRAEAGELVRNGSTVEWVGHWHTHPTVGEGVPSQTDLDFFAWDMRELHQMGRDPHHYVALFVTPTWQRSYGEEPYPSWAKPTITAWHVYPVSDDQFIAERATLA